MARCPLALVTSRRRSSPAQPAVSDTRTRHRGASSRGLCYEYICLRRHGATPAGLRFALHALERIPAHVATVWPRKKDTVHSMLRGAEASRRLVTCGNLTRQLRLQGFGSFAFPIYPGYEHGLEDFTVMDTDGGMIITSPNVKAVTREHFGCDSLRGAEFEDDGASGTVNSHWEERIFQVRPAIVTVESKAIHAACLARSRHGQVRTSRRPPRHRIWTLARTRHANSWPA